MNSNDTGELPPSELGTKEYWTTIYKRDINNFDNHGDAGEIWFGGDIVDRILKWFDKNVPKELRVADLGCGNGMFLVEAAQKGYTNVTGFDYCEEAVDLAKAVVKSNGLTEIDINVVDLTGELPLNLSYDILVDKGTYDAISLNPTNAKDCRLKYLNNVLRLLSENGYFLITSCNWTEQELVDQMSPIFSLHSAIPTPTFKFGGKEGSLVSSVVFKKRT